MALPDGTEPIADDEILYRRIPASQGWVESDSDRPPSPQAFHPRREDRDGISLCRAKCTTLEKAARGRPGKEYYVAVLRAGDLRRAGIEVIPTPTEHETGHASVPALNSENRRDPKTKEAEVLLASKLTLRVEGPFSTRNHG